jgi:hypothetical protein
MHAHAFRFFRFFFTTKGGNNFFFLFPCLFYLFIFDVCVFFGDGQVNIPLSIYSPIKDGLKGKNT